MDVNYSQPNRRDKCTEIPGIPVEDGYFTDDYLNKLDNISYVCTEKHGKI